MNYIQSWQFRRGKPKAPAGNGFHLWTKRIWHGSPYPPLIAHLLGFPTTSKCSLEVPWTDVWLDGASTHAWALDSISTNVSRKGEEGSWGEGYIKKAQCNQCSQGREQGSNPAKPQALGSARDLASADKAQCSLSPSLFLQHQPWGKSTQSKRSPLWAG